MNELKNEITHTPGPWYVSDDCVEIPKVLGNIPVRIGIPYMLRTGVVAYGSPALGAEMAANARIIAAAPDLYEATLALRQDEADLVGLLDNEGVTLMLTGRELKAICAAIAKAEGKP